MRTLTLLQIVLALSFGALAGNASTIPGLLSTGLGTACSNDPTWTAQGASFNNNVAQAALDLGPTCGSGVVPPGSATQGTDNWYANWPSNSAGKFGWIGVTATNRVPAPNYTFTETFNMTGLNPLTASITGYFDVDDDGQVLVNGHVVVDGVDTPFQGAYAGNPAGGFPFTVPVADLLAGTNTIQAYVNGADGADDGVIVYITNATANPSTNGVPEPASYILFAGGIALVGFRAYRRASQFGERPER